MAPEDTTMMSRFSLWSEAMSEAKLASQSRLRLPATASTSSDEPTFTTMRRKEERVGVLGMGPVEKLMAGGV